MCQNNSCQHHSGFNFGLLLGLVLGGTVGYFLNQQQSSSFSQSSSPPHRSPKFDPLVLKEKLTHLRQTLARLDATLSQNP